MSIRAKMQHETCIFTKWHVKYIFMHISFKWHNVIYQNRPNFERKFGNNLPFNNFNICLGCSKERFIEAVLLSSHNLFSFINKQGEV